ncbi:hypothetical protein CGJ73_11975, partial [Vibrio parahaemolyticus]
MTELTYLSGWRRDLCIKLDARDNLSADFNRFLFNGLPSSKELQQSNQFKFADREAFVVQLKDSFSEKIDEGVSHDSLYGIYVEASQYLRWCDKESEPAFTQSSLEGYMEHLQTRVMLGELKSSTYKNRRANMVTLFSRYLDLPHYYFNNVVIMDNSDSES